MIRYICYWVYTNNAYQHRAVPIGIVFYFAMKIAVSSHRAGAGGAADDQLWCVLDFVDKRGGDARGAAV